MQSPISTIIYKSLIFTPAENPYKNANLVTARFLFQQALVLPKSMSPALQKYAFQLILVKFPQDKFSRPARCIAPGPDGISFHCQYKPG